MDVQRALGQPVACRDGLPQTSLSCQLTRFPRVPQCQRPSESVSANTWGREAGKMFRSAPGGQTRAAKQWLSGNESNCVWVLINNSPRSRSWGLLFFCYCVFVRVGDDFNYLTCLWVVFVIYRCANKCCFWLRPSFHRGLSAEVDSAWAGVIKNPACCSSGKASRLFKKLSLPGSDTLFCRNFSLRLFDVRVWREEDGEHSPTRLCWSRKEPLK